MYLCDISGLIKLSYFRIKSMKLYLSYGKVKADHTIRILKNETWTIM